MTDWLGKETTFAYNRDSQVKGINFPSTTTNVDEYAYNKADQLSEVSIKKGAAVLASMVYTRDKLGQVEKDVETGFSEEPERKYEYDAGDRLLKSNGTLFEYDKAGNVTKISPTTYTYDKADQIATASNAAFEYNKLGQRVKETPTGGSATTYSYDQAGNLVTSKGPVTENTFKYDGTGLRTTETKGASTYPMFWDTTPGLPLLLRAGNDYFVYGPDGLPFEQITSGSPTYLHHDQMGSTRVLTNPSGEISGTYRYGPNGAFWKFTGTQGTQMGFAGQYRMRAENQLIYLRARTYDPVTAQFLSVDPIVGATGESYSYASDNPVNAGDPSGLSPYSPGCPCPPCEGGQQPTGTGQQSNTPGTQPTTTGTQPTATGERPAQMLPPIVVTAQRDSALVRFGRWVAPYAVGAVVAGIFFVAAPEVGIVALLAYNAGAGAVVGVAETGVRQAMGEETHFHDYASSAACGAATSGIYGVMGEFALPSKVGKFLFAHGHSETYGTICDFVVHEVSK